MTEAIKFDNPVNINSLDVFRIKAISGNSSPVIYANTRNQLPVQVVVKASDKDNKVLKFSEDQWVHMLSLCFAHNNEKLNWRGNRSWCFTNLKNDYSREVQNKNLIQSKLLDVSEDGTTTISMYIYTNDINRYRIAARIDIDDGKTFTTADAASGAEKSSIQVTSIPRIDYRAAHLDLKPLSKIDSPKSSVYYDITTATAGAPIYTKGYYYFTCFYENYIYSLSNGYEIANSDVHNYGSGEWPMWIASYGSEHNNQHMIVVHPFSKKGSSDEKEKKETFGFDNYSSWTSSGWGYEVGRGDFNLKQEVTYPVNENKICFTQMTFNTDEVWKLPDNKGMDGQRPFYYPTWFEIYDMYGNYGQFSVSFSPGGRGIQIQDR